MKQKPVLCLMGPTATGKTPLAVQMVQHFPCEIVSVDSAQVYRNMDIGTAKPSPEVQKQAPHHLIDIVDAKTPYSAGQFRADALKQIKAIHARGKIPLLVGGTMLYFRVLQQGLAQLPSAEATVRDQLDAHMQTSGLATLYAQLKKVDPVSASRIHENDSQRIKRALEVYLLTGKCISDAQVDATYPCQDFLFQNVILFPKNRVKLHMRIAQRFEEMLQLGFVAEVEALYQRGDLISDLPAIRSVGYRQVWDYLSGNMNYSEMRERAIIATRQLAKRQMTWLRSWTSGVWFDSDARDIFSQIKAYVESRFYIY